MFWKYSIKDDYPYGDDTTYKMGMDFLSDCDAVDDWGCGAAYSKHFCKGAYKGIDHAPVGQISFVIYVHISVIALGSSCVMC
jgi:hypothetical protein